MGLIERVLVVGAGAVGAYYGSLLARSGADVSVVCRSDYDVVVRSGFRIESPSGEWSFLPSAVYSSTQAASEGEYDVVMVCTKVLPEVDVTALLTPVVGDETTIVLLQNGIRIEPLVQEVFPSNTLVSGLAFVCLNRMGEGRVVHQGFGRVVFGDFPSGCTEVTKELVALFESTGIMAKAVDSIRRERWKKLVWNAPFNPLSVLAGGVTTDKLLGDPMLRGLVSSVMDEVQLLAMADGVELDDAILEKNIQDTDAMDPYKTSMLLDYEANRPMEVDAILGNAYRFGIERGVECPHIALMYGQLKWMSA